MIKLRLDQLKNDFRHRQPLFFVIFVFFLGVGFAFFAVRGTKNSVAISNNEFDPGNIISDVVMANYNSMTATEIQAFLTEKNPCNNRNYALYKEQTSLYPRISWHWTGSETDGHFVCLSEEKFGEGVELGTGETAAEIIYAAAQENKINPQVLLVLLEKEQGLISDTYPHSNQYRSATGYGCPDTAACDSKYFGFKNQVFRAAELFRYTLDNGSTLYPDNRNGVYIGYNPSSSCGGTEVFIENRATSALYRYTPYQPNAAALAAGFGKGDVCSAYGNRNFYLYFTKWFGSTQAQVEGITTILPNGLYGLASKSDKTQVIASDGANLSLQNRNTSTSWQWQFERLDDGYYKIINTQSKKALIADDSTTACAQKWKVYQTPDDYLTLESVCTAGMVLSAKSDDDSVRLNVTNNSDVQKWQIYAGQSLPDGTYTIRSEIDPQQAVDITDWRMVSGNRLQIWRSNEADVQKWTFKYNASSDTYTITNINTNFALDLDNAEPKDKGAIQIWKANGTCAQGWRVIPVASDNKYSLLSACDSHKLIEIDDATASNGAKLQLYSANNSAVQRWSITPVSIVGNNTYTITSALNRAKAVDISGGAETATTGTNIQLWDVNHTKAQQWVFTYDATKNAYVITNPTTQKVIYLTGAGKYTANQTNVQLGEADGTCSQFWNLTRSSDGSYTITTTCPASRAFDAYDARTANGTNIQIWDTNQTAAQKWYLVAE